MKASEKLSITDFGTYGKHIKLLWPFNGQGHAETQVPIPIYCYSLWPMKSPYCDCSSRRSLNRPDKSDKLFYCHANRAFMILIGRQQVRRRC